MYITRKTGLPITILFMIAAGLGSGYTNAQSLFLSPDTVKVCSGSVEEFDVELRADELVYGLNAYSVFIGFDKDMLELYALTDTSYWQCMSWQIDSTCIDSVGVAWDVDSTCVIHECTSWQITDSSCLDSSAIWDFDSLCLAWEYEWHVDSTCLDSIEEWEVDTLLIGWECIGWNVDSTCLDSSAVWSIDSTCLNWECIEWDTLFNCIDSACTEWQVDTTIVEWDCYNWHIDSICLDSVPIWDIDSLYLGWTCIGWDIDSTVIDSSCTQWNVDSTFTGWQCHSWDIDSVCVDSVCTEWHYDSTAIAWDCTSWSVDSTCLDSVESTPESADFMVIDTILYPITEGPLLYPPEAQMVKFFTRMAEDSSILIIESLIFWPRISIDGPGLLATIHMRNKGTGIYDFSIDSLIVLDIDGNRLPVSGAGNVMYFNPPPESFNLLLPTDGAEFEATIGDSIDFSWEESKSHCLGASVLYELIVSNSPFFPDSPGDTRRFPDINGTAYSLGAIADLWNGSNYWKIRSYTDFGSETYSVQEYWDFTLDIEILPPGDFSLIAPSNDTLINVIEPDPENFQWMAASTTIPNDTLRYDAYFWQGDPIPGQEDWIITLYDITECTVAIDSFDLYQDYSWSVKCTNRVGMSTWSIEIFKMFFYLRGDANGDGSVDVADPVYLINYIFKGGPPPPLVEMGDANCDGQINVGDPVYLINYIFKGGPPPCPD